jgi:hypothetical protein
VGHRTEVMAENTDLIGQWQGLCMSRDETILFDKYLLVIEYDMVLVTMESLLWGTLDLSLIFMDPCIVI